MNKIKYSLQKNKCFIWIIRHIIANITTSLVCVKQNANSFTALYKWVAHFAQFSVTLKTTMIYGKVYINSK